MIVRAIIEFLVNLIPTFTMPVEIIGSFAEAASWVLVVNHYIPINTFVACVAVYFVAWISCAVISAVLQLL